MKANRYLLMIITLLVLLDTKVDWPLSKIDIGIYILIALHAVLYLIESIKEDK